MHNINDDNAKSFEEIKQEIGDKRVMGSAMSDNQRPFRIDDTGTEF